MSEFLNRSEMLLGASVMKRLAEVNVILFGIGGVGSWCAEGLVRTGLRRLTIVDADTVCPTNVNRQLPALPGTVGQSKVEVLKKRLESVNPEAEITAVQKLYTAETCGEFNLVEYDFVIDAIDTLQDKCLLIRRAIESGSVLFSSMGAANKFNPAQIRTAPLEKVQRCQLAKAVRRQLKKTNAPSGFLCVYSEEESVTEKQTQELRETSLLPARKKINGSLVQVTAPFGFALCSLVVNHLLAEQTGI